jgi:hypothetical protein
VVNGQAQAGDAHPREDVTGTIDFFNAKVEMVVKVASRVEGHDGTLTAALSARIVLADYDGDGVSNIRDNCKLVPNPDQKPVPTPAILPPPDRLRFSCIYRELELPGAADLCNGGPVTMTHDAPPKLPKGLTVVNWTAKDTYNRTATAAQQVVIEDRTPPVFTSIPPNVSLQNCVAASLPLPTGVDDCDASVSFTNDAPSRFPLGPTPVTWTVRDSSGNGLAAVLAQVVTVTDTVKPSASCAGEIDPEDTASALVQVAASDACSAPTLTLGSYTLSNGEVVKLTPGPNTGVFFLGEEDGRKHFQVGPKWGVVRATDASGNVQSVKCSVAPVQY